MCEGGSRCKHCKIETLILTYENALFRFKKTRKKRYFDDGQQQREKETQKKTLENSSDSSEDDDDDENDENNEDSERHRQKYFQLDSDVERILRFLSSYTKDVMNVSESRQIRGDLIEDATNHLKLFSLMKKEMKTARDLWRAQFAQLDAFDELG